MPISVVLSPTKVCFQHSLDLPEPYSSPVGTLLDKLETDLALYRKAFNQRILYFRQLQEISDSVSDVVFENTAAQALQECATEQQELAAKVSYFCLPAHLADRRIR